MKKFVYTILGLSLILLFTACEAEEFEKPVLDLELVSNEVHLNLITTELASTTVSVRNGNGGYRVQSSDENVATVSNAGTGAEIKITGVNEGTAVITVTDALGKTATIDVVVSVLTPTTPTFTWKGQNIRFDRPGGAGITAMPGLVALSDIIEGNSQYILTWSGGFSEGEKTNAKIRIVTGGAEPVEINLVTLKILKANSDSNYIVFSDGENGGQLYFTDYP